MIVLLASPPYLQLFALDEEEVPKMDLQSLSGGDSPVYSSYLDSASSTPFASNPSSPGRSSSATCSSPSIFGGYFFSCPASPVHYVLSSSPYSAAATAAATMAASPDEVSSASFEFNGAGAANLGESMMISADELFLDGKIRPRKVSAKWHQHLAPLDDVDDEDEEKGEGEPSAAEGSGRGRDLRIRTRSRRTRSMSPDRSPRFNWQKENADGELQEKVSDLEAEPEDQKPMETTGTPAEAAAMPASGASSRSSSSSSSSQRKYTRRWIFFKDLLHRSKSEGSGRGENVKEKEKFWHSFSPSSFKSKPPLPAPSVMVSPEKQKAKPRKAVSSQSSSPPSNGSGGRRQQGTQSQGSPSPSLHERHYAVNRAQAEEMRRRTFLPYRQGLLGCLVFGSRSYSAINGLARTLNPVSSR